MIKIIVTDDHAIVRRGLRQIVGETSDIVIAAEAENATQLLELLPDSKFNVLVLDINLPGRSGFDILKQVKILCPKMPILIHSMHSEDEFAVRMLKAGASGYITKESAPDELIKAIRKVNAGGRYVSTALGEKLALGLGKDDSKAPHEALSDREYQIMYLIASGKMSKDIAKELSLSVKTVSTYRARVLEKMQMKTNAELTRYAILNQLV
ncbi:MAG: response regulator transcription factor [Verrucomicrobiota bacterium]